MKHFFFFYIICVAYVTCEVLNEKEEDLLVRNILKKAEELTKKSYETKKKDVVNKPDLSSKVKTQIITSFPSLLSKSINYAVSFLSTNF